MFVRKTTESEKRLPRMQASWRRCGIDMQIAATGSRVIADKLWRQAALHQFRFVVPIEVEALKRPGDVGILRSQHLTDMADRDPSKRLNEDPHFFG